MDTDFRGLRRRSFSENLPYDELLGEIGGSTPSHRFLANRASQNTYLYLCQFVVAAAQAHFARPLATIRILDWGTGKGHFTHLLMNSGAHPLSCDIASGQDDSSFSQQTPIISRRAIHVIPLTHDYALPFDGGSVDVVLSVGVLEHVKHDAESMKEIARILVPGGLFFCFNLPYTCSWTQRLAHLRGNYYHDRLYSWARVRRLLSDNGLSLRDGWHRQLLPKNSVSLPAYRSVERFDQWLTTYTPLKYLATNLEFVAEKTPHAGSA